MGADRGSPQLHLPGNDRRLKSGITSGAWRRAAVPACLVLALATAACSEHSSLYIRVMRDDGRPDAGLDVTILPVDPEALYDSLTAAARTPPPHIPALDEAMRRFQPREAQGAFDGGWEATRDSVEALADSLRGSDRRTPEYRTAYTRLRRLYDRLGQRAAARDRATRGENRDLADRAARAAEELRRWERSAFAGYDTLLARRIARSGRQGVRASTDPTGVIHVDLAPGRWWLRARRRVRDNPFLERLWNVPVTTNGLVPVHVRLVPENGLVQWRH